MPEGVGNRRRMIEDVIGDDDGDSDEVLASRRLRWVERESGSFVEGVWRMRGRTVFCG